MLQQEFGMRVMAPEMSLPALSSKRRRPAYHISRTKSHNLQMDLILSGTES